MTCDRKLGPYDCCSVVQGDCLELMAALPDGCVDAVITDPPYGVNLGDVGTGQEIDSQAGRILNLLSTGEWVPLPRILELRISQYGSRVLELRRKGFQIENRTETVDGVRHSWFRLVR